MINLNVTLSIEETAAKLIHSCGELIDQYDIGKEDCLCQVLVFENYSFRTGNRGSLTVTIHNFENHTAVHAVASGSSRGLFTRFDWGAASAYEDEVEKLLSSYIQ